jgi:transcriptional regulator with XRE-family HTH domain
VARGLSQEALVVDAEIDRTYVIRLERNFENPTVHVLEWLDAALKCKIVACLYAPERVRSRRSRLVARSAQASQIPLGGWINVGRKVNASTHD